MRRCFRHAVLLGLAGALTVPAVGTAAIGDIAEFGVTGGGPQALTTGPDGNLWIGQYTEVLPTTNSLSGIGRMTPSGTFTGFSAGIPNDSAPLSIATGPDSNLWFTEAFNPNPALARATTAGAVTTLVNFAPADRAENIVAGPDGNMWFSVPGKAIRADMSGAITTIPLVGHEIEDLASGPGGYLWFADSTTDQLVRLTTAGATSVVATFATGAQPWALTAGPDGNLWVVLRGLGEVARVTPTGTVATFSVSGTPNTLAGIATGADGNLWVTEGNRGRISRVTTSGVVTPYAVPRTPANLDAVAPGPDGNIWYADPLAGKVGRVLTGVTPSSTAAPAVTGTPKVGQVLTVSNGTWNHVPTGYAYSWQRCASATGAACSAVRDQTASTYTVTRDDVGKFLIASVTATSLNGTSQASTAAAVQVAPLPRLTVAWSRTKTKRKKATVTALVTLRRGVTSYRMSAVLTSGPNAYRADQNTRSGRCVRAKVKVPVKKGKKPRTVVRQRCTISLPVGAWSVTAEGWKGTELLAYTSRAYRIS